MCFRERRAKPYADFVFARGEDGAISAQYGGAHPPVQDAAFWRSYEMELVGRRRLRGSPAN
jgi:hypothetical protein